MGIREAAWAEDALIGPTHDVPDLERKWRCVMKANTSSTKISRKGEPITPVMSPVEFAKLGGGQVAYIRVLNSDEARRLYPAIKGLPEGIDLYALHAADGTPIALTDSRQAAIGHARGDKLEVASVH
jgi:hypothetical protein